MKRCEIKCADHRLTSANYQQIRHRTKSHTSSLVATNTSVPTICLLFHSFLKQLWVTSHPAVNQVWPPATTEFLDMVEN
eukprot:1382006-Amorphochlora_amoeboformis.AAC.2